MRDPELHHSNFPYRRRVWRGVILAYSAKLNFAMPYKSGGEGAGSQPANISGGIPPGSVVMVECSGSKPATVRVNKP